MGVVDFFYFDWIVVDYGCVRNDRRIRVLFFEGRVFGDDGEGVVENVCNCVCFVWYVVEIS